ncbi:hypothetical protein CRG98_010921, partial [Punica granatum]
MSLMMMMRLNKQMMEVRTETGITHRVTLRCRLFSQGRISDQGPDQEYDQQLLGLCRVGLCLDSIVAEPFLVVKEINTIVTLDRRNQPLPNLPIQVPQIPLDELKEITNNFGKDAHIGEGPYGKVYKGILKNGKDAAIKKLYECAQSDDAFRVQISIASSLKHPNVTALLGYCINGESRILAYEFASIGTLRELLHGNRETADPMSGLVLSWDQRVRIAAQAARGLEYLHEIVQLVHRAIKSANILIFDNFVAKIADYDLTNQSTGPIHSNRLIGGYGYSAPECALTGKQTTKSDVYSFGVVLLELLTGRKTYDNRLPLQQRSLVAWATPLLSTMVGECVDPRMDRDYPPAVVAE